MFNTAALTQGDTYRNNLEVSLDDQSVPYGRKLLKTTATRKKKKKKCNSNNYSTEDINKTNRAFKIVLKDSRTWSGGRQEQKRCARCSLQQRVRRSGASLGAECPALRPPWEKKQEPLLKRLSFPSIIPL